MKFEFNVLVCAIDEFEGFDGFIIEAIDFKDAYNKAISFIFKQLVMSPSEVVRIEVDVNADGFFGLKPDF